MLRKESHFRWLIVGLLFFVTMMNYIDRASIAYAMNAIESEFSLSPSEVGSILGVFGIGYSVSTFLGGLAADYLGAKRTLVWATLGWMAATVLMGCANGFLAIMIARLFLGLAEGPNFPGMARVVGSWLPETERARSLSLALMAVPLALALGGPIVSTLITYTSWRVTYFILAAIVLLWVPVWIIYFRDNPADSSHVNPQELAHIGDTAPAQTKLTNPTNPWPILLGNRTLLANYWAFFVFGFYLFFFMTWLPEYLHKTYHLTLIKTGFYTFFPWLLAALLMWACGQIADRIFKRTQNMRWSRSYPIMISQLLAATSVLPIIFTHQIDIAMIFISLAVGFAMSANAAFYAVNIDVIKQRAGTALGIMELMFAFSGFLAPTLTGYIVSWSGHFEAVFWVLAGLGLSSTVTTWLFHNTAKPV